MSTNTNYFGFYKPDLTDRADITQFNKNWDIVDGVLNAMAESIGNQSQPQVSYMPWILEAVNWEGSAAPYTYRLDSKFDEVDIEVVENVNMTLEQLEVIENAKIKSDPSSDEHILYAFGEKPTIDVPVMLIVRT